MERCMRCGCKVGEGELWLVHFPPDKDGEWCPPIEVCEGCGGVLVAVAARIKAAGKGV
jgi:hypothetical protein